MKRYMLGVFAVVLAISFSAFTAARVDSIFKITGQTTIGGQTAYLTNDANPDVVSDLACGSSTTQKCRISTPLIQPRQSGATWYFLAADGTLKNGVFQP